jgi:hypothetical protein
MGPRRALATVATALVLGGCVSTSLSATEVRVPVLLGPVPCIGCGPEKRQQAAIPVAHLGGPETAFMLFLPVPPSGWGIADDSQLGISADRLLFGTSCQADLQLSNLHARAWMLSLPLLFYYVNTSVEGDATQVIVPGASCGEVP